MQTWLDWYVSGADHVAWASDGRLDAVQWIPVIRSYLFRSCQLSWLAAKETDMTRTLNRILR